MGDPNDASILMGTTLRGVQPTDADGIATFDTLMPGHYDGRATHIHGKPLPHLSLHSPPPCPQAYLLTPRSHRLPRRNAAAQQHDNRRPRRPHRPNLLRPVPHRHDAAGVPVLAEHDAHPPQHAGHAFHDGRQRRRPHRAVRTGRRLR